MKLVGLSRQVALTMMAMAFGITLLVVVTSYAFYFLADKYWPDMFSQPTWLPTGPEWIWLGATTLAGLALAVVTAVRLAGRILVPLNSLADGIRRVAKGDLSARAEATDRSLSEAVMLAEDFNALASQLQRMTEDREFWNAAIAHELRTPVTILRGRLQGLVDGVFAPDAPLFHSLLAQVEGLGRLIEDLRAVSLAESGHLDMHIREVDLSAEVRSVVDFSKAALQAAGKCPMLELEAGPVYCDPVRIRQALLALLENARRHAVPGAVRIQTRQEDGWCTLQVEDDGPGIPSESVSHVFTAFRRMHNTEGDAGSGGDGLGLAVVAAIATAHGGSATCRPSSTGGACFELRWPSKPTPRALHRSTQ